MPNMGIKKPSRPQHGQAPASRMPAGGLASTLFGNTQQRVLALLFGQPERRFFVTELIELAGAGSGAVQRELKRLADGGLVVVERMGNQKYYQANADAPIYAELRSIVTKTLGPAEVLRDALQPLTDTLRLALLYGSLAKRTDRADSDVDILLVSDTLTLEQVYASLAAAERQLSRRINPTLYTPAEFRERRRSGNPFLERVLVGEYVLLSEDKDDLIATRQPGQDWRA